MHAMTTKKDHLRGALRRNVAPANQDPQAAQQLLEGQPAAPLTTEDTRGASYALSTAVPLADLPLRRLTLVSSFRCWRGSF